MGRFALGFLICLVAIVAAVLTAVNFGYVPAATNAGALPFEHYLAGKALNARIAKEAPKEVPIQPTPANLVAGAQLYRDYCIACHGAATGPKTVFQQGMYPRAPLLVQGKGVTDDPPGESYWKVKNGIRLTGMPSFSPALNETQLWQVSLFVANAHNLPQEAMQYVNQLPAGVR
jgi:thiosulfate dehydrogenase